MPWVSGVWRLPAGPAPEGLWERVAASLSDLLVPAQGWGNILNLVALLFFLGVQGQTGPNYDANALSIT